MRCEEILLQSVLSYFGRRRMSFKVKIVRMYSQEIIVDSRACMGHKNNIKK